MPGGPTPATPVPTGVSAGSPPALTINSSSTRNTTLICSSASYRTYRCRSLSEPGVPLEEIPRPRSWMQVSDISCSRAWLRPPLPIITAGGLMCAGKRCRGMGMFVEKS